MEANQDIDLRNLPSDPNEDDSADQQNVKGDPETKKDSNGNDPHNKGTILCHIDDGKIVYYRQSLPKASEDVEHAGKSDDPNEIERKLVSLINDSIPNSLDVIPCSQECLTFGELCTARPEQVVNSAENHNRLVNDSSDEEQSESTENTSKSLFSYNTDEEDLFNRSVHTEYVVDETDDEAENEKFNIDDKDTEEPEVSDALIETERRLCALINDSISYSQDVIPCSQECLTFGELCTARPEQVVNSAENHNRLVNDSSDEEQSESTENTSKSLFSYNTDEEDLFNRSVHTEYVVDETDDEAENEKFNIDDKDTEEPEVSDALIETERRLCALINDSISYSQDVIPCSQECLTFGELCTARPEQVVNSAENHNRLVNDSSDEEQSESTENTSKSLFSYNTDEEDLFNRSVHTEYVVDETDDEAENEKFNIDDKDTEEPEVSDALIETERRLCALINDSISYSQDVIPCSQECLTFGELCTARPEQVVNSAENHNRLVNDSSDEEQSESTENTSKSLFSYNTDEEDLFNRSVHTEYVVDETDDEAENEKFNIDDKDTEEPEVSDALIETERRLCALINDSISYSQDVIPCSQECLTFGELCTARLEQVVNSAENHNRLVNDSSDEEQSESTENTSKSLFSYNTDEEDLFNRSVHTEYVVDETDDEAENEKFNIDDKDTEEPEVSDALIEMERRLCALINDSISDSQDVIPCNQECLKVRERCPATPEQVGNSKENNNGLLNDSSDEEQNESTENTSKSLFSYNTDEEDLFNRSVHTEYVVDERDDEAENEKFIIDDKDTEEPEVSDALIEMERRLCALINDSISDSQDVIPCNQECLKVRERCPATPEQVGNSKENNNGLLNDSSDEEQNESTENTSKSLFSYNTDEEDLFNRSVHTEYVVDERDDEAENEKFIIDDKDTEEPEVSDALIEMERRLCALINDSISDSQDVIPCNQECLKVRERCPATPEQVGNSKENNNGLLNDSSDEEQNESTENTSKSLFSYNTDEEDLFKRSVHTEYVVDERDDEAENEKFIIDDKDTEEPEVSDALIEMERRLCALINDSISDSQDVIPCNQECLKVRERCPATPEQVGNSKENNNGLLNDSSDEEQNESTENTSKSLFSYNTDEEDLFKRSVHTEYVVDERDDEAENEKFIIDDKDTEEPEVSDALIEMERRLCALINDSISDSQDVIPCNQECLKVRERCPATPEQVGNSKENNNGLLNDSSDEEQNESTENTSKSLFSYNTDEEDLFKRSVHTEYVVDERDDEAENEKFIIDDKDTEEPEVSDALIEMERRLCALINDSISDSQDVIPCNQECLKVRERCPATPEQVGNSKENNNGLLNDSSDEEQNESTENTSKSLFSYNTDEEDLFKRSVHTEYVVDERDDEAENEKFIIDDKDTEEPEVSDALIEMERRLCALINDSISDSQDVIPCNQECLKVRERCPATPEQVGNSKENNNGLLNDSSDEEQNESTENTSKSLFSYNTDEEDLFKRSVHTEYVVDERDDEAENEKFIIDDKDTEEPEVSDALIEMERRLCALINDSISDSQDVIPCNQECLKVRERCPATPEQVGNSKENNNGLLNDSSDEEQNESTENTSKSLFSYNTDEEDLFKRSVHTEYVVDERDDEAENEKFIIDDKDTEEPEVSDALIEMERRLCALINDSISDSQDVIPCNQECLKVRERCPATPEQVGNSKENNNGLLNDSSDEEQNESTENTSKSLFSYNTDEEDLFKRSVHTEYVVDERDDEAENEKFIIDDKDTEEPEVSDALIEMERRLCALINDSISDSQDVIPCNQECLKVRERCPATPEQVGNSKENNNGLLNDSSDEEQNESTENTSKSLFSYNTDEEDLFNRSVHTEYVVAERDDEAEKDEEIDVILDEKNETVKEKGEIINAENAVEEIVNKKPRHEENTTAVSTDEKNNSENDSVPSSSRTDPETMHSECKWVSFKYCLTKRKLVYVIGYSPRKVNLDIWYSKSAGRYEVMDTSDFNNMIDPVTKCKVNGEPLDPVPPHRWARNVVCGYGDGMKMAQVSGPGYLSRNSPSTSTSEDVDWCPYQEDSSVPSAPSADPSHDENAPTATTCDGDKSPSRSKKNKFSKNTIPKSSTKRHRKSNSMNDSHVGEQTPHTSGKNDFILNRLPPMDASSAKMTTMRAKAALSPQPIRVRDMPLPSLSWVDNTELSLLMSFKEDIGITDRCPVVFRRNPNLNTRMRAILFDWLIEVCDVYKLRRVTYYLAIDYIDRYLSKTEIIPKNYLQLLGITCLFIAAKIEEIYPPKLAELAYVTDGACTDVDMLEKEMDILKELRWDVNPMTVSGWLSLFLQLSCTTGQAIRLMSRKKSKKDDDVIYPQFSPHMFMTASMILDLCSLDDGMLQFKYSVIAASVIYFVVSREKALFVSGYPWEDVRLCVEWMYPFAMVALRTLSVRPLPAPRETRRNGSALRTLNSSIVLEEGHCLQTHVIDLKMLEEVYAEISEMRRNFKREDLHTATGWSASEEGQGYDPNTVLSLTDPPLPRIRRSRLRTCTFAQAATRNDNRVYHNTKEDPPVELTSESDDEPRNNLNEIDGAVPPVKKVETRGSEEDLEPRSSPFESQNSSSLFSECSQDLALAQEPKPPVLNLHYVDEDGNLVDPVFIEEISSILHPEQANTENTTGQSQNDKDESADPGSNNDRGLVEKKSNNAPLTKNNREKSSDNNQNQKVSDTSSYTNPEQRQGMKRRRSEEFDVSVAEEKNSENNNSSELNTAQSTDSNQKDSATFSDSNNKQTHGGKRRRNEELEGNVPEGRDFENNKYKLKCAQENSELSNNNENQNDCDTSSDSKSEQRQGVKRRRNEEFKEKVSKAREPSKYENNERRKKKSCYQRHHQEGQEASFEIQLTRRGPSVVAPEPAEVFPTRGSDLRMQRRHAEQNKDEHRGRKLLTKPE